MEGSKPITSNQNRTHDLFYKISNDKLRVIVNGFVLLEDSNRDTLSNTSIIIHAGNEINNSNNSVAHIDFNNGHNVSIFKKSRSWICTYGSRSSNNKNKNDEMKPSKPLGFAMKTGSSILSAIGLLMILLMIGLRDVDSSKDDSFSKASSVEKGSHFRRRIHRGTDNQLFWGNERTSSVASNTMTGTRYNRNIDQGAAVFQVQNFRIENFSEAEGTQFSSFRETLYCSEECCHDTLPLDRVLPPQVDENKMNYLRHRQLQESDTGGGKSSPLPPALDYVFIVFLLVMSALFSGLTLGFMSMDITGLRIVIGSDDKVQAAYAKKVLPIRKNGNLLLCTLVLGNVAVNALLSILMADKAGGILGFLLSTVLIVIFGEIAPQAACARHALYIGSNAVPMVRFFLVVLYPIAKPIALCLDLALGRELLTMYNETEMLRLLQLHVDEKAIDLETAVTMTGALQYRNRLVRDVMTPVANVFMLSTEERLNFVTLANIFKSGYSRIPVYEQSKDNVVGLLLVKDLIFIDPEDATRVSDFIEVFGRQLLVVWDDDKLGGVLLELKKGKSHMALVRHVGTNPTSPSADPFYEIVGIITLEDIIEEILGDEIVDETDKYRDGSHSMSVDRGDDDTMVHQWTKLRLLDSKIVDEYLSPAEASAVVAHLQKNHSDVFPSLLLTEKQFHKLVQDDIPVSVIQPAKEFVGYGIDSERGSFRQNSLLPKELLYTKGVATDICTLILAGKVTVVVGEENFHTDVSNFALLGSGALGSVDYKPDFSAYVSGDGPIRCLQFTYAKLMKAIDASSYERSLNSSTIGAQIRDRSSSNGDGCLDREDVKSMSLEREKQLMKMASDSKHNRSVEGSRTKKLKEVLRMVETDLSPIATTTTRAATLKKTTASTQAKPSMDLTFKKGTEEEQVCADDKQIPKVNIWEDNTNDNSESVAIGVSIATPTSYEPPAVPSVAANDRVESSDARTSDHEQEIVFASIVNNVDKGNVSVENID